MRKLFFLLLLYTPVIFSQSKSIDRFRSAYKENSNVFFYSSTLKMLNTENNPEFANLLRDIEEIRVLNYNKADQKFSEDDVAILKSNLQGESYNSLMMMREKGNSIDLYSKERRGKTTGIVAVVENDQTLTLIDLIGSIDVKKFMELKQRLDSHL
jgi:hypothetical protein